MADYQVRKYNSWYHHMALVMMAMHFILKKRLEKKGRYTTTISKRCQAADHCFAPLPRRDHGRRNNTDAP
ncbi:MAG: hypothetical protein IT267_06090 [Saprospiraceae bacterium]|nr:hypothetical protein [Saprospiraceae bacterium]